MFSDTTCTACGSDYDVNPDSGLCPDCAAIEGGKANEMDDSGDKEDAI